MGDDVKIAEAIGETGGVNIESLAGDELDALALVGIGIGKLFEASLDIGAVAVDV